jgi:hypothetical protein
MRQLPFHGEDVGHLFLHLQPHLDQAADGLMRAYGQFRKYTKINKEVAERASRSEPSNNCRNNRWNGADFERSCCFAFGPLRKKLHAIFLAKDFV